MFKKFHLQLTFLLTAICSFIMIAMTLCYLYIAEKSLKENSYLAFQGDCKTIFTNLENNPIISYEWIAKLEYGGKYLMNLYDNGSPLSYNSVSKSYEQQQLLEQAFLYAKDYFAFSSFDEISPFSSHHSTSYFTSSNGDEYYISYGIFPSKSGSLEALLLFSLQSLQEQIKSQRILFLIIDFFGILAILGISLLFTYFLLKPIAENTKKQTHFIASASHELKTPLTVITSALSAIRKSKVNQESFFEIIEEETVRMSRLVEDMLLLANSDNHSWTFTKSLIELDTLLINCYEAFSLLAQREKKLLSILLPENSFPPCFCDAQRIEQVVCILLDNALSYTSEGGKIIISLSYEEPLFSISISDNGPGISDLEKPYIFDRFYRADSSHSQKGHFGLGLCIAKEIVQAHHGKITVTDTEEGGCTFYVILPQ